MAFVDNLVPLAVSLAIGLLIGTERGWRDRDVDEGERVAGVRTFGLIGLLGGFVGLLADQTGLVVLGFGFLGLAAVLVAGYTITARDGGGVGVTSLVASLLTFAFGAAATLDHLVEAAMAAVVTTLLLDYKSPIHRGVQALGRDELRAMLKLLAISVLVLPILPDEGFGPWDAVNPFRIWWMVVLIAGLSFAGYFAMRLAGPRKGALLTGLLGGLASSTALTLHFSRLARARPEGRAVLACGTMIACATLFPRIAVVVAAVAPALVPRLLAPLGAMMALLLLAAAVQWWLARRKGEDAEGIRLDNPLALRSALVFGAILAVVMVAAEGLQREFGDAGAYATAGLSGLAQADAAALTMAQMSGRELAAGTAAVAIVLAGAVNNVAKTVLAAVVGGVGFALRLALPLLLAAAVGLAIALFVPGPGGPAGA